MEVKIVTLRYHDGIQGFPGQALRDATAGREVLEAREHFFVHGNIPHLAIVLMLGDGVSSTSPPKARQPAEDPAKDLPPHLQKLYRDLRQWRNDRAKKDGVPSYVIMRNILLADLCRKLPRTLAQLKEVEGIGDATCARYGKDILGLLSQLPDSFVSPPIEAKTEKSGEQIETKKTEGESVQPKTEEPKK